MQVRNKRILYFQNVISGNKRMYAYLTQMIQIWLAPDLGWIPGYLTATVFLCGKIGAISWIRPNPFAFSLQRLLQGDLGFKFRYLPPPSSLGASRTQLANAAPWESVCWLFCERKTSSGRSRTACLQQTHCSSIVLNIYFYPGSVQMWSFMMLSFLVCFWTFFFHEEKKIVWLSLCFC